MTRKKTTKKAKDDWNIFGLRVIDYNVDLDWGFNSAIHDNDRRSDDSPVYESNQQVLNSSYPPDQTSFRTEPTLHHGRLNRGSAGGGSELRRLFNGRSVLHRRALRGGRGQA
jgi:hypothetical protein